MFPFFHNNVQLAMVPPLGNNQNNNAISAGSNTPSAIGTVSFMSNAAPGPYLGQPGSGSCGDCTGGNQPLSSTANSSSSPGSIVPASPLAGVPSWLLIIGAIVLIAAVIK